MILERPSGHRAGIDGLNSLQLHARPHQRRGSSRVHRGSRRACGTAVRRSRPRWPPSGPATTSMPSASAVSWFSRALRLPAADYVQAFRQRHSGRGGRRCAAPRGRSRRGIRGCSAPAAAGVRGVLRPRPRGDAPRRASPGPPSGRGRGTPDRWGRSGSDGRASRPQRRPAARSRSTLAPSSSHCRIDSLTSHIPATFFRKRTVPSTPPSFVNPASSARWSVPTGASSSSPISDQVPEEMKATGSARPPRPGTASTAEAVSWEPTAITGTSPIPSCGGELRKHRAEALAGARSAGPAGPGPLRQRPAAPRTSPCPSAASIPVRRGVGELGATTAR